MKNWEQDLYSYKIHPAPPKKEDLQEYIDLYVSVPSQQKWTQKSFKKRNESQYFVNLLKPTAFIPRFA